MLTALLVLLCATVGHGKRCDNPVPGLYKQARGVDITKLDMMPLDIHRQDGYMSPVIELTCNEGKKHTLEGLTYDLPDQVWTISDIPSGALASSVQVFKTSSEVRRSMERNAGIEGSVFKFGFSASGSYSRMQTTLTRGQQNIEHVAASFSARRVDLQFQSKLRLGATAKELIDSLPASFKTNPGPYENFISHFGTHYFANAKFGGLMTLYMETSSDYYSANTETAVKAQAKAAFLSILKAKGGYSSSVAKADSAFTSKTTKTVRYFGGSANLMEQSGIQAWQPTISGRPWLFSGKLAPISDLIVDARKKESMRQAIQNYMAHAYLKYELPRILQSHSRRWTYGVAKLDGLLTRATALDGQRILDDKAVEDLGEEVTYEVAVPSWFTQNTRLCYNWYPDGPVTWQCGPGVDRLLCAIPNSMTTYYRDDTHGRAGGCQMRWGIRSGGQDTWFNQVQLCFKFRPDGDARECGAGSTVRERCAPINTYTSYYRDDTHDRAGGCWLQWKIAVPRTLPVWLHNLEICFEWYADGDRKQECHAEQRVLCARANSWTSPYRDDTTDQSGGCQMRWGLRLQ